MKNEEFKQMNNTIQNYASYLKKRIEYLEKRQKVLPHASLKYLVRGNSVSFYKRTLGKNSKLYFLPHKNKNEIINVSNATYIKKVLPKLKQNLHAAEKFLSYHSGLEESDMVSNMPDFINRLNANIFLYRPGYITEWQSQPYIRNPYKPEGLIHDTARGEKVRSKSEVIIADELFEHTLPYKPEHPLQLKKSGRTIYPDFLILHPETLKEIIWEHFGMMDNPDYAREAYKKINAYANEGYFIGESLICTFETSDIPLTRGSIELYIKKYFF